MTQLWLDDETFSPEPITNGVHKYAEGVEILIRALALDDGPVLVFDLTPGGDVWQLAGDDLVLADPFDVADVEGALGDERAEVWAHNSHFDRTVERHAGLAIPLHRWRDTMIQAMAHSLPGKLETLCEVLGLGADKAKDKAGKALIQLFCKPVAFRFPKMEPFRAQREDEKKKDYTAAKAAHKAQYLAAREAAQKWWPGRATRESHPAEWRRFLVYAGQDINAMRACHKIMPKWNYPNRADELALWHQDQRINDRGVAIDTALAAAAVRAVDIAQAELRERTVEVTSGEVASATQRDAMLLHVLAEYGVDLPDMQMATLERRIADPDLPEGLRELLRIRLQASTTSTSKYKTLMRCVSSDSRLRALLQFCGANRTGRWAGRLWQPQNLPRPVLKQDEIDLGIQALMEDCAHLLFDNVMQLTSSAIRGCIVAPEGRQLVVADLSNIEGRVLAWLAGETWKIKAFSDFDAGTGFDLYALAYAKSFNVSPQSVLDDKKAGGNQRQVGKVQELALGYEGGVGAFLTFAAAYGIDLEVLADQAFRAIPQHVMAQANIMFEWHRDKKKKDPAAAVGLSKKAWLVCESFKLAWREAHPNIRQFWKDLDETVRQAIDTPGSTFQCRMLKVRRDGKWLRIVLPSGRALCYPSPEIDDKGRITYMGMNQYTRKWCRLDTYGGKLAENCIAANTEVLTEHGWMYIQSVQAHDRVWDGVEWVAHNGCVYKGKQVVLTALGVTMTPDHLVLTSEGWKNASSCEGLDRAGVGLPDGDSVRRSARRAPVDVGSEMRVRHGEAYAGVGVHKAAAARGSGVVWVHEESHDRAPPHHARHVEAPGVRSLAQHDRPLPPADAPGVPQLRRAGYRGVQALARFVRKLLGGYGPDLRDRPHAGAPAERQGVFAGELPVAIAAPAGEQQTHLGAGRDTAGPGDGKPGRAPVRHRALDAGLEAETRVDGGPRTRPVFDLINCGPRHRFVVRGADGIPLIVHNCTQAVARDVMAANMPAIESWRPILGEFKDDESEEAYRAPVAYEGLDDDGFRIVLSVHDELICEAPDTDDYNAAALSAILATVPDWAPGLPLAAAGFEAYRYKKD